MKGEGNGNPLQHSCLENPMDGGARRATVHGVAKSQTWLSGRTTAIILSNYKMWLWRLTNPGSSVELDESWWWCSSLKAGRLKTQEEPMFSSESKGRKWLRLYRICLQCRRYGFDPWLRRSPGEGNGCPCQYSSLENPHGQRSLRATAHGVTKSRTRRSDYAQAPSTESSMVLAQKQMEGPLYQKREPRSQPRHPRSTPLWQRRRKYRDMTVFSEWCWESWTAAGKSMELEHTLPPYTK